MPLAFGLDLRKRLIAAVDDSMHIDEAAKVFRVSRRVIYEWLELRKKTGSLAEKTGYQKGHSHKITDWEAFKIFAESNRHQTVKKMTIEWEKINNETISETAMERALKKIGYTSKKTFGYIEANAEKRKQFLEEIENIDLADIVYSDETGIDDNEVTSFG